MLQSPKTIEINPPDTIGSVRAVERALQLVELIAKSRSPLSIADLTKSLSLAPSTVHRLLQTLVAQGYVLQYQQTKRYGVGRTISEIGRALLLRHDLSSRAGPYLEALVEATGETANLASLYGTSAIYLNQVESPSMVRIHHALGSAAPLHASAMGKVFLADFSPQMLEDALQHSGLERFTDCTITDRVALETELETIQKRGYAIDNEELELDVRCIAAPIRGTSGLVISAIGISGPSSRMTKQRLNDLAAKVLEEAQRLSKGIREP
jgi:IclR family transcriptional regulator, acetate operon repressor